MVKIELRTFLINVKRRLHRIKTKDKAQTHVHTLFACLRRKFTRGTDTRTRQKEKGIKE